MLRQVYVSVQDWCHRLLRPSTRTPRRHRPVIVPTLTLRGDCTPRVGGEVAGPGGVIKRMAAWRQRGFRVVVLLSFEVEERLGSNRFGPRGRSSGCLGVVFPIPSLAAWVPQFHLLPGLHARLPAALRNPMHAKPCPQLARVCGDTFRRGLGKPHGRLI